MMSADHKPRWWGDECLFAAQDLNDIETVLCKLQNEYDMHLEEEDDVSGFLDVKIEKFENLMGLTQHGLKQRIICKIISALWMQSANQVGG